MSTSTLHPRGLDWTASELRSSRHIHGPWHILRLAPLLDHVEEADLTRITSALLTETASSSPPDDPGADGLLFSVADEVLRRPAARMCPAAALQRPPPPSFARLVAVLETAPGRAGAADDDVVTRLLSLSSAQVRIVL